MSDRSRLVALVAILAASAGVRMHHLGEPMADSLQAKQVYVANKARSIAREPVDPLRNTLDFLDEKGERTPLIEEVPLFTGLLGLGYRLFGERDGLGHALGLVGTILALAAFFDLVRNERGDREAIVATILLSATPLLLFYGRAVLPDPWMLAGMLASAACYRRYLDGRGVRWLVLAAVAGTGAALFKYFGLMVILPLAEMARRRAGSWRGVLSPTFLAMVAATVAPVALWMVLVFDRSPNPVRSGWADGHVMPYLIVQAPGVLLGKPFWAGLLGRFPIRDCGAVAAVLMGIGAASAIVRRSRVGGFLLSWTVMGLLFFVLLGPKLRDHDYYELMMLPAASLWAARGLEALASARPHRRGLTPGVLALAVVVQSPWVSSGLFRQDIGKIALAGRLRSLSGPGDRVVAIGPGIEFPTVIHYSTREGWPVHSPMLPGDWRSRLDNFRSHGARLVAVYFEPKATPAQRASYEPLLQSLPEVERRSVAGARGRCEFVILSLKGEESNRR